MWLEATITVQMENISPITERNVSWTILVERASGTANHAMESVLLGLQAEKRGFQGAKVYMIFANSG